MIRMKTVRFADIPDKAFVKVHKKREIVRVRLLTPKEKHSMPRGSFDVLMQSATGDKKLVDRNVVLSAYRYPNGKSIDMHDWSNKKSYVLMRNTNQPALGMLIPSDMIVDLNGRTTNQNSKTYIVGEIDSTGNINRSTVRVISGELFRKMFTVDPSDIIDKYRQVKKSASVGVTVAAEKSDRSAVRCTTGNAVGNQATQVNKQPVAAEPSKSITYNAIARLLNSDNQLVGFKIQGNHGSISLVTMKDMLRLCQSNYVSNVMIVNDDKGNPRYLRGNGIKISDLPPDWVG